MPAEPVSRLCDDGRWRDENGYRLRAAGICLNQDDQICLVSSHSRVDCWIIPGGGIEHGETSAMAAQRELIEEAGVLSTEAGFLATFIDEPRHHKTQTHIFRLVEMKSEWLESTTIGRRRQFFTIDQATTIIKESQRHYLVELRLALKNRALADQSPIVVTLWPCACVIKRQSTDDEPEDRHEKCEKTIQFTKKKVKTRLIIDEM